MSRFIMGLVVASAFGPYLILGVRTEQAIVYTLAILVLTFAWPRLRLSNAEAVLVFAWTIYVTIAAIGWVSPNYTDAKWAPGSALANADNLLLPVATFLLIIALRTDRARDLTVITTVVTIGASANAILAVLHYFAPRVVAPMVGIFWGSGDTGERAAAMGRLTGVVGQPSVAGILYSIGMVCAIFALRDRAAMRAVVLIVLGIGGLLTASKAFFFIGMPIVAWQLFRSESKTGQKVALFGIIITASWAVIATGILAPWSGLERVSRLLPGGSRLDFTMVTGNRYGSGSSTEPVVNNVLEVNPLSGFGLGGLATATDTALVQALVLAGITGVACVVAVMVVLITTFWRSRMMLEMPERLLFGGIVTIAVVGSLGTPALTANRVSVLIWVLLAVCWQRPRLSGWGYVPKKIGLMSAVERTSRDAAPAQRRDGRALRSLMNAV